MTPTKARIEEIRKWFREDNGLVIHREVVVFLLAQLDAANATIQKLEAENAKLRLPGNVCWDDEL